MPAAAEIRGSVDVFVLAGGRSLRMGVDKARLDLDGVPLVVDIVRRFAPWTRSVRVVAKSDSGFEDLGVPLLYDAEAAPALVHGLRAALEAPGSEWRFVLACDMPAVSMEVLESLWEVALAARAPGSAPRLAGRAAPEPLPSLWHRRVAFGVTAAWGLAARDWVRAAGLVEWPVPPSHAASLIQCNTPHEWAAWLRHRAREGT